jgi:hypothetical protein
LRRAVAGGAIRPGLSLWYLRYREAVDTQVTQAHTIAVRWILRVLMAIPLTPWWVRARRRRSRREMREHLRRYYANGQ